MKRIVFNFFEKKCFFVKNNKETGNFMLLSLEPFVGFYVF
ncbi:hypothetical protein RCH33_1456 [Flavobacterium daejeonense]|nr:hypothetical protein RCH33_1456 [Flavobacterium daejeonense]